MKPKGTPRGPTPNGTTDSARQYRGEWYDLFRVPAQKLVKIPAKGFVEPYNLVSGVVWLRGYSDA